MIDLSDLTDLADLSVRTLIAQQDQFEDAISEPQRSPPNDGVAPLNHNLLDLLEVVEKQLYQFCGSLAWHFEEVFA